jgi:PKD repeat protein
MKKLFLLAGIFCTLISHAQSWQPVASGLNSSTHGMCLWNNMLVDAGSFGSPCGRVAGWNGTTWNCFGSGVGIVGRACVEYNGDLIVCGDFWNVNQPCNGCNGIARWDGTNWLPLGTGFNNDVLCLTVWNGNLVAGGDFTAADGNPCNRVAMWNGTTWVSIGGITDFDNDVRTLTVYNGELWAGGDFVNAGGCTACDRVVKWNGTQWVGGNSGVDIPGGLDSTVRCFYVDQAANKLYMGGHFLEVGGNTNCSGVAVYDGNAWQPMGTGVDNYVRALGKYNGNIIVGGDFLNAGGNPASKIAKWNPNNSTWSAMGSGMNDYVKAIEVYNGELYAGGPFTIADGLPRSCVARWYEPLPPVAALSSNLNNICIGQCVDFTDNSTNTPTSWNWSFPGAVTTSSTQQNPTGICYNSAGTYLVTLQACNVSGCNSATMTITVSNNTPPVITLASSPTAICPGGTANLTASGANTYTWSPSSSLSSSTGSSVVANPTVTTTYTVVGTNGCSSSNTITLTVNQGPAVTISPSPASICQGGSVVLNASGAASYTWSPPAGLSSTSGSSVTANPVFSTTYTINATGLNGCTSTSSVAVTVIPSLSLPIVEDFQSTFLPANWSMVDDGNDGNTWLQNTSVGGFSATGNCAWFPNNSVNAPNTRDEMRTMKLNFLSLSTAQMTFDVAYARQNGPSSLDTLIVYISTDCEQTWTPIYTKGGSTLSTAPNQNGSFTPTPTQWRTETINLNSYIGNSVVSFAFQNRNHNGNNLYVDNINITGTNTNPPTPAILTNTNTTCPGTCITVNDNSSGLPTSWNWSFPGASPSSSTLQNPGTVCYTTAGTYTITLQACNSNGCNTITTTITVTQTNIQTAAQNLSTCSGGSVNLGATGGVTYQWSPASGLSCVNCQNPTATPVSTTTYTVTGTDISGCTGTATVQVLVNQVNLTTTTSNDTICSGSFANLNATGAMNYSWTPAADLTCSNCANPVATPTVTTTYTVVGTDANGCTATNTMLIEVEICTGNPETISLETSFSLYPNPATESITVVSEEVLPVQLSILDVTGKELRTVMIRSTQTEIDLRSLPAGIYLFRFIAEEGTVVKKVVRN